MKILLTLFSIIPIVLSLACASDSNSNKLPTAKEINGKFPEVNVPRGNFPEAKQLDANFPKAKQLKVKFPEPKFLDADFPEARLPQIKFPQIKIRESKDLMVITLPADVLFDFDKDEIRPDANQALQEIKETIAANYSNNSMQINGHTDSIAADEYNQDLSERRAMSVLLWLAEEGGISENRMQIVSYGEKFPIAPDTNSDGSDNSEGRQKNRRVEIVILKTK